MGEPLSFKEYKEKYRYKRSDEVIAYTLYLILKKLDEISSSCEDEEGYDNDDSFIGNWTDKPILLERKKVEINGSRRDR